MSRIFLSPPDVGPDERRLLLEAFDSNWIAPLGPHVDAFERELSAVVDVPYAVALSSGTAALHLALSLVGVKPGDEVLTSTLTFAATANAIMYRGGRPVFIDSDAETWTLNPALLRAELEACAARKSLPRAVLVVDLYGQCADYDRIIGICDEFGVPVIEDAAEALGSTYRGRSAGSFGVLSAFSFNGNKIITTSAGGMLVSHRSDWIDYARFLSTQARDVAPHYQHSEIGYNYRMSNLLAAVGRGQLQQLSDRVNKRRANNAFYREAFAGVPGISFIPEAEYGRSNHWLTAILVDSAAFGASREDIRLHLEQRDIEARPVWKPMHLQPAFAAFRRRVDGVSDRLFETGLCLPSGSSLTSEDRARVVDAILDLSPAARSARTSAPAAVAGATVDLPQKPVPAALAPFAEGRFVGLKRAVIRWHQVIAISSQLATVAIANVLAFALRFDGDIPSWAQESMWSSLPVLIAIRAIAFIPFRLYQGLWRYTSLYDLRAILKGIAASTVLFIIWMQLFGPEAYPRSVFVMDALLLLCGLSALRLSRRFYEDLKSSANARRVLIVGAGSAGELVARDMLQNRHYGLKPIGFIDDAPQKKGRRIHGVPVVGTRADMPDLIKQLAPEEVVVAMPSASPEVIRSVLRDLEPFHLGIKTLPSLRDLLRGEVSVGQLRAFRMEDLLQRAPARLEGDAPRALIEGRRVLVTGAGSGIGAELCRQILGLHPARVVLFDRFEQALRVTTDELAHSGVEVVSAAGDVADEKRLAQVLASHRPEIVFHTGAHNGSREVRGDASAAVRYNVRGSARLLAACASHGVERLVVVSTTAVANPTTALAATQQLTERVLRARAGDGPVALSIVRLGSILGRPDSVVPRFREQIRAGGPVKVTHPEVRRYFMLLSEAVTLTLHAAAQADPGSVHVLDMGEPLRIVELARNMIRLRGMVPDTEVPIEFTGLRKGERILDVMAAPNEIVAPSSTKGLLRVRPMSGEDVSFLEKVDALAGAAERHQQATVLAMLADLVPMLEEPAELPALLPFSMPVEPAARAIVSKDDATSGQACPKCGRHTAQRSRARSAPERLRRRLSSERLFRCMSCGWRGWMAVMDIPRVASPLTEAAGPDLGDLDLVVAGVTRDDDSLDDLD